MLSQDLQAIPKLGTPKEKDYSTVKQYVHIQYPRPSIRELMESILTAV